MLIERAARFAKRQAKALGSAKSSERLFRGDDALFLDAIQKCSVYGEYGCGASTIWCADNTDVRILGVDTSMEWIEKVRNAVGDNNRLKLLHVDLGALGDWGRPNGFAMRANFSDYVDALWWLDAKPDLILIDGRFRVACFLKSLVMATPGSVILFDDYIERSHYHVVEEFIEPVDMCGAQVKFVVPASIDKQAIEKELRMFTYVMD